ncbi:hypothetical protein ElyMa_001973400 [Elysia marginata]|uniref:Reverse transcriptase domain-containing protein n=1 Tax=Elysia marginata TaxID=1093978 RepID=A0AAV4F0V8_9GAST|nr:hypothetical protein ElyMa_001973400 [Elysia marginata]
MRDVEAEDTEDKYSAIKLNGNPITELRYADDTALLSKTPEGLNELNQNVKKFSMKKNLLLNAKKTRTQQPRKIVSRRTSGGQERQRQTKKEMDSRHF